MAKIYRYFCDRLNIATTDWTVAIIPRQWNNHQRLKMLKAYPLQREGTPTGETGAGAPGDTQLDCCGFFFYTGEDRAITPLTENELFGDYEPLIWEGDISGAWIHNLRFCFVAEAAKAPIRFEAVFEDETL